MKALHCLAVLATTLVAAVPASPAQPADKADRQPAGGAAPAREAVKADNLTVEGRLTDKDEANPNRPGRFQKVHKVKLAPGKVYRITLDSTDFDAFLRVEDSSGAMKGEDDDGGGNRNARLEFRPLKEDVYRIIATSYAAEATGAYTLKVAPVELLLNAVNQLSGDDAFDRVRSSHHHKVHAVKLKAGRSYTIDLVSDAFDAYLRLENFQGKELAQNDDGGSGHNARLTFTPTQDGTYRLIVTTFGEGETGPYTLTVKD